MTTSCALTFDALKPLLLRFITVVFVLALAAPAWADRQRAMAAFDEGTKAYNLGRFAEAVGHFERAYEEEPAAAFLFNIAQAHRLSGHCAKATFFYRRFLSAKPDTTARAEIEMHLQELDRTCAEEPAVVIEEPVEVPGPLIEVRVEGGVSALMLGDLSVPVQPAVNLTVFHPFRTGPLECGAGLGVQFMPVPYEHIASGTASLLEVRAHGVVRYGLAPWLSLRVDVGAGALLFLGLDDGNPFTKGAARSSGALSMFVAGGAVGADIHLNDNVAITLRPIGVAWSPGRSDLADDIEHLVRLEAGGGLSVRF